MNSFVRISLLGGFLLSMAPLSGFAQANGGGLGLFDDHSDVGAVQIAGSAIYDPLQGAYVVTGSGTNMWANNDEFHFVWRRIRGDFAVQALTEFLGQGDPHRKMGIMIRGSLDTSAPHVNACRHGDGLVSLQFRRNYGTPTEEIQFDTKGADVLQLARRGETYTMSAARRGEVYATRSLPDFVLGDRVYVGIYVCAHNNAVAEKAVFRNVRVIRPAKDDFVPYRDYIGSDIELLDLATGIRRVVHHADDSLQAPNWPEKNRLVYNHNGRMFAFDLSRRQANPIDTGEQVRCNNDHALSFNGRQLGISSGEVSTVYVLSASGGKPKQVTTQNPSYLHGWSPDGKSLLYTGIRNGEPDIYRIPAKGGAEQRLTDAKGLDDGSEYTPDGKTIYFNSERTGRMQVWRMKADGSGQEQVTNDEFNNWFPHVSPDGKSIVFLSYGADIPSGDHPFYKQVYVRRLDLAPGAKPTVVAYLYGGQGSINVNSWSPDSKSIAFVSNSDKL
ncbi:biopolymer transporter TolR [Opitutaceae bacterium EW11]|nr:biopolymer transporter TolR [Opitutaceae bacterium EW11]